MPCAHSCFLHWRAIYLATSLLIIFLLYSYYHCSPYVCPKGRTMLSSSSTSFVGHHQDNPGVGVSPLHFPVAANTSTSKFDKALVVASMMSDDTVWLHQFFPYWRKAIYVMDDITANLTVQLNKGRESTAYLTYIIDNYDELPSSMIFLHAARYQWHNEDPLYGVFSLPHSTKVTADHYEDGVPAILNLRLDYLQKHGYANLRCTWRLGCPAAIFPFSMLSKIGAALEPHNDRANTAAGFAQAYKELFPGTTNKDVPTAVGVPCCAQFALSSSAVRARPVEDYIRVRNLLWTTKLPDAVSGRVLEYVWHILMGKSAEYCPDAQDCFCGKFGLCDLECRSPSSCERRYTLPKHEGIPHNWPEEGSGTNGFPRTDWWQ
ncbi:hypothetical protein FH972_024721 [Carpinus fangiana]|uniref:Uncharacterized protein n=1 Tax=Carpinus fangiana TaxID=176857 RepID=A0A5N6KZB9_9ROSI|nr:hypothetical protein FH972_024721 [Carpinus fangiana]